MKRETIEKIALLIGFADEACSNCVSDMVNHANRMFPEWKFHMEQATRRIEYYNEYNFLCSDRNIIVSVERR